MRGALAAAASEGVSVWVQMWFPAAWAEPGPARPVVRRVHRPRAHRVLGPRPVQQSFPVVRLYELDKDGHRRKCSPFARARTVPLGKVGRREGAKTGDLWDVELERLRPKTRADCIDGPRPCPWLNCRHHLAIDVNLERGSIKEVFPHLRILSEPEGPGLELLEEHCGTCSLDVADRHDDGTGTHGVGGLLALRQAALSGKPLGQTPGLNIEDTGRRLNLSIERTRQLSSAAMQELRVKLRRETT